MTLNYKIFQAQISEGGASIELNDLLMQAQAFAQGIGMQYVETIEMNYLPIPYSFEYNSIIYVWYWSV